MKAEPENNIDKLKKPLLLFSFVMWYIFFSLIYLVSHNVFVIMADESPEGVCNGEKWQYGDMYQFVEYDAPCNYNVEFWFFHIFYILLYLLYDGVRRYIVGFNPSIKFRLQEVGLLMLIYWLYSLSKFGNIILLDYTMFYTSVIGTFLWMLPLFILAALVKLLDNDKLMIVFLFMLFIVVIFPMCCMLISAM